LGTVASGYTVGDATAGGASCMARYHRRLAYPADHITNERKEFGDSAPNARPQKTGAQVGSRLQLEWIAGG